MIILYTALIFSCVWFGVCQARKLESRQAFYENMHTFLIDYRSNLSFLQKEFKELAEQHIKSADEGEFNEFLVSHIKDKDYKIEFLTEREQREAREIIGSLGKQDAETEEKIVDSALKIIKLRVESATKKRQKYSGFSIKISLLIGVLLVILLL